MTLIKIELNEGLKFLPSEYYKEIIEQLLEAVELTVNNRDFIREVSTSYEDKEFIEAINIKVKEHIDNIEVNNELYGKLFDLSEDMLDILHDSYEKIYEGDNQTHLEDLEKSHEEILVKLTKTYEDYVDHPLVPLYTGQNPEYLAISDAIKNTLSPEILALVGGISRVQYERVIESFNRDKLQTVEDIIDILFDKHLVYVFKSDKYTDKLLKELKAYSIQLL